MEYRKQKKLSIIAGIIFAVIHLALFCFIAIAIKTGKESPTSEDAWLLFAPIDLPVLLLAKLLYFLFELLMPRNTLPPEWLIGPYTTIGVFGTLFHLSWPLCITILVNSGNKKNQVVKEKK